MPLTPKRACSLATTKSQEAASWQPAAVAMPWTSATTGFGRVAMRVIRRAQAWKRAVMAASPPSGALRNPWISRRSWPAQKARPSAARISTRAGETEKASTAWVKASIIASDKGFSLAPWARTIRVTGP